MLKIRDEIKLFTIRYSPTVNTCYTATASMSTSKSPQTVETFNPDLPSVLKELEEGHYLFLIADRKKAFLFLFDKGELETSSEVMDPGVKKNIKSNSGELYGRNTKLTHHIENQIHDHLKRIMQEAVLLIKGKHINGVFIGGHQPFFHEIENELPQALQKILRSNFVTELNIPKEQLIERCKQVLEEYRK